MHRELNVVVCCVRACSAMVFTVSLNCVLFSLSEKALLIVDEKGNYWGICSEGSGLVEYLFLSVISFYCHKMSAESQL